MNRMLKVFASLIAACLLGTPAYAVATSGFATNTSTIDNQLLAAGTNWPVVWINFCGYHTCDDHGGGLFHREACTPDNVYCIADSVGNTFARQDPAPNGILDAHKGGLWMDGTHTDSIASINAVLTAAAAHGATTVKMCGKTIGGDDAAPAFPAGLKIDLCGQPIGSPATLDFTLASNGPGILALPGDRGITLGENAELDNGTIECSSGSYAPPTFVPVTLRDKMNVQANMLTSCNEAAITLASKSTKLRNLQILGFGTCVSSQKGSVSFVWEHVWGHCGNGVLIDTSPDLNHILDARFFSYLVRGGTENWSLDNVLSSGGHYVAVIAVLPSDIQLVAGDPLYMGPAISGGAQSLAGRHVAACSGNCAVVSSGTDGCSSAAQCQEVPFTDAPDVHATPVSLTMTWSAGLRSDGVNQHLVTSGDLSNVAVGQALATSVTCTVGGVTVNAFPNGTTVYDVWKDRGKIIPSNPPSCAGTAQTVTATDGAFTNDGRGALMSAVQMPGTCASVTNSTGTVFSVLHCYNYNIGVHCGDGCHHLQIDDYTTGDASSPGDEEVMGVLCDGNHTGDDCDMVINGGILGQGATTAFQMNSDSQHLTRIANVAIGPGRGKSNGVMAEVLAGQLTITGSGAQARGNFEIADSAEFRVLSPDSAHMGTGFTAGNVATTSGGTCTTAGQLTIDTVNGSGVPKTWHQSLQGVCSVWPSNPVTMTGGSGTGLKTNTDGVIANSVSATNIVTPQGDWYTETAGGPAFNGSNNTCLIMAACNSTQTLSVKGVTVTYGYKTFYDYGGVPNSHTVAALAANNAAAAAVSADCNSGVLHGLLIPGQDWYFSTDNPFNLATPTSAPACNIGGIGFSTRLIADATGSVSTWFTADDPGGVAINKCGFHDLTISYNAAPIPNLPAIKAGNAQDCAFANIAWVNPGEMIQFGTSTEAAQRIVVSGWTGNYNNGALSNCNIDIQAATGIKFLNGVLNGSGDSRGNANGAMVCIRPNALGIDTVHFTNWIMQSTDHVHGKPYGVIINSDTGDIANLYFDNSQWDWTTTAAVWESCTVGTGTGFLHVQSWNGTRLSPSAGAGVLFDMNCGMEAERIQFNDMHILNHTGNTTIPFQILAAHDGGSTLYLQDSWLGGAVEGLGDILTACFAIGADGWNFQGVNCGRSVTKSPSNIAHVFDLTGAGVNNLIIGQGSAPYVPDWILEPTYSTIGAVTRQIWRPRVSRTIATGAADTATIKDSAVLWNSATASAKAQALFGCTAALHDTRIAIIDEKGTAGTNNITITPASGTIQGGATLVISANNGAISLVCDGNATNWVKTVN